MKNKIFYQLKAGEGGGQLICFPYLGGYANSFCELANALGEDVEVWAANPPGHGRCTLKPAQDIKSLLDLYDQELPAIIKPHAFFFGYSMGGVVAYFLAQRLFESEKYPVKSITLILSACGTPGDFKTKNYSRLSDDDLIEHMRSYDGISEEIIREKTLLQFFLPVFRSDFRVLENAATCDFKPLEIPTYLLWGEKDNIVPMDTVVQWLHYVANEIKIIPIENGLHMFITDKVDVVAKHIGDIIVSA